MKILQAYVSSLRMKNSSNSSSTSSDDLILVLISTSSDAEMFKQLHNGRLVLQEHLSQRDIYERVRNLVTDDPLLRYTGTNVLHMFFKYKPLNKAYPAQCLSSFWNNLVSDLTRDKIMAQYYKHAIRMRVGSTTEGIFSHFQSGPNSQTNEVNVMTVTPSSNHSLVYTVLKHEVIVGLATADSELHVSFSSTVGYALYYF